MCTLTYRLTDQGYQLFFNRDEQRTRPQAIPPTFNAKLNAIYPIDPTGGGTWIGAHQTGTCLALLNYYQAQIDPSLRNFTSRGEIIPTLLAHVDDIHKQLNKMDLTVFQAFQLCVFAHDLSAQIGNEQRVTLYVWDGQTLTDSVVSATSALPITSSGVDYPTVLAARQQQFKSMISEQADCEDFIAYHHSQVASGKCSVKMSRDDAHTVSFTHICVDQQQRLGEKVKVDYVDHLITPTQSNHTQHFQL